MRISSYARFPFESIVRNGRRSMMAMLGTIMAIVLISGSLVAVDSAASGLVMSVLDEMPYDMLAADAYPVLEINGTLFEEHAAIMEEIDGVEMATPLADFQTLDYQNPNGTTTDGLEGRVVMISAGDEELLETYKIEGSVPDPGTVAIGLHTSRALNLGVGDYINIVARMSEYDPVNMTYNTRNLTIALEISEVWSQEQFETPNVQGGMSIWYQYEDSIYLSGLDPVVMRFEDAPLLEDPMREFYGAIVNLMVWYQINIDREEIVRLGDLPGTLDRLHRLEGRLDKVARENGFEFRYDMLEPVVEWVRSELDRMKVTLVALSLPVVALGGFLSAVGIDLGSKSRRKEVAALKSRGASKRQIIWLLTSEAIGLGAIAGAIGLPLGLVLSRGLSTFALAFSNHPPDEFIVPLSVITLPSVALSVAAGILIMLGSSRRPFMRYSRLEISEGLRGYAESESMARYSPRMDIAIIALSALGISAALVGGEARGQLFRWMFEGILNFLVMVGLAISFAVPLLLSVGIVRLLVHGSKKLYLKAGMLVKPFTRQLHHIVEKNMARNSRRATNLCLMISLALAFGIFISVTISSTMAYEKRVVEARVGADIEVNGAIPSLGSPSDYNLSGIVGLRDLDGVRDAVEFQTFHVVVSAEDSSYGMRVTVFDGEHYDSCVGPSDFFFDSSSGESFELMKTKGNGLITKRNADLRGLTVGDFLPCKLTLMTMEGGTTVTEEMLIGVTVVGVVSNLPGFQWTELFLDWSSFDGIEFEQFHPVSSETAGSLIQLEDDADSETVAQSVEASVAVSGFSAETIVLEEELAALEREPSYRALSDFMYSEFGLLIVIISVGLGLMTFAAEADREQETASMMARGASASQMRMVLIGETLTYLLIGGIVGISVGFLTGGVFNLITGKTVFTVVERTIVIGPETVFVLVASIASLLLASVLVTLRAGKIRLAEALRIRNG